MKLWNKTYEKLFFNESISSSDAKQLFNLTDDGRYVAYWPNMYKGKKTTLQSRNSMIGDFTENFVMNLFEHLVGDDYFIVKQAQIPSLGINSKSPADIVISTSNNKILKSNEIKLICEVKMSIIWNWEYNPSTNQVTEIGDYRTHQGKPSFTRSDSILKAIGKSVDIRVSSAEASKIPIIILGNAPLSNGFCKKADHLKSAGIIQGFWSLNPSPLNHGNTRKTTPNNAFIRFDKLSELNTSLDKILNQNLNFFSGMNNPAQIGKLVETANQENTYEHKGLKFLNLLRGNK